MDQEVRKLPDYRKIAANCQKRKIFLEEEEIIEALSWLQKSRAKFIFKPGPCQLGDFIEIEYWSPQINNGQRIKDGFILGQGNFIPGFEENLIGLEAGQEKKEIILSFPFDFYKKDLAGKKITLHLRVISVQKMELPEIDDQFAQNLGRFGNLNDLKESIKEGILLEKEKAEKERWRIEVLRKINQEAEFDISPVLIEKERERMLKELKEEVGNNLKISFEDYLAKIKKDEKEFLEILYSQAQEKIKNILILREIARRENIVVSPEETREEINKILKSYPNIEAVKSLDINSLESYIKDSITQEKTLELLESFTKI